MSQSTPDSDDHEIAREDTVLFVEERDGERTLVGCGGGNFLAPVEVSATAEDMLEMLVDIDSLDIGSKVGIVSIQGHGPNKQVTVRADVDESVTREDYEYSPDTVDSELATPLDA